MNVLTILDETIRHTEAAMPTPMGHPGESREHPVHFLGRLHDLKRARAVVAEMLVSLTDLVELTEPLILAGGHRSALDFYDNARDSINKATKP